ncbi:MAG: ribosome maturation factor RimM [Prevotellaceae bacterium]|nr:ribosome maturation factor RimM [Prevotellaceae bacterium]
MIREADVYKIGQIGKPHGVKGEIQFAFSDDVWDRTEASFLFCKVDGILVPFMLEEYRFTGDTVALLKFHGIDSPEAARQLGGLEVFFPYELTPEADEEVPSWHYFQGFQIVDEAQGSLGTIDEVDDSTTNVLFRIGDLLIPAAEDFIVSIDQDKRLLTMRLPEGLTDI